MDDDPYFRITYIPAGTYPNQNANITTLGVPAILQTSSAVSSNAVYAFTKSVFSSGRYNPYSARNSLTFSVSPGADRFYQEAGVYRKQHLQKIVAQWIAPSLVIFVVLVLIFKFRIVRFFRMKDIPRVAMILVAVWLIGTSLMYYAEHKVNDYYGTLPSAAWSTLMNWINFGAKEPYTSLGRATSVVMTALGYGGMLWLLAEAASLLIQKKLKKEIPMKENHHVIINWNDKGAGIVEQLSNPELPKRNESHHHAPLYKGQARFNPSA